MFARMRSVLGWFGRQLENTRSAPVRPRRRPVRVPSIDDPLERRQVLSAASISPFVTLPGLVTAAATPSTPTNFYYGQPVAQGPLSVQAASLAPLPSLQAASTTPITSISATTPDAVYVQSLYRVVLGRVGAPSEVSSWLARMDLGLTPQGVAEDFIKSIEHRQDEVGGYYEQFLHRAPDPGSALWVDDLLVGVPEQVVEAAILDSPEYQSTHQDPSLFVRDLFIDVLGRQGIPSEVAGWQSAVTTPASRQQIVADFVVSPEANGHVVDNFYASILDRPREQTTSNIWVDLLDGGDSVTDVAIGILSSVEFKRDSGLA